MSEIKLPAALWPFRRYGLLIGDAEVVLLSWRRGSFEEIARFGNDSTGVGEFSRYLKEHAGLFKNRAFHVLINLIGEDYRYEKVPHLVGLNRTEFFKRKISQVFRGATYTQAMIQGREELGRREDLVLFYGILTNEKIQPWMRELERTEAVLAGVCGASVMAERIFKLIGDKGRHVILMTFHENDMLRQVYYGNGKLRFGRMSKTPADTVENMARSLRREAERMLQYLHSLKLGVTGKVAAHVVVPAAEMAQLRELVPDSERVAFHFRDAQSVSRRLGASNALRAPGRDSTHYLQTMFSALRWAQMASFNQVRLYWLRLVCGAAIAVFAAIAGLSALTNGTSAFGTLAGVRAENTDLQSIVNRLNADYNRQTARFGEAPSTPSNMRAVSNVFAAADVDRFGPGPLMLYISRALSINPAVRVDSYEWFLTDNAAGERSEIPYLSGQQIWQVVRLTGEIQEQEGASYDEVLQLMEGFIASFEARADIVVTPIKEPARTTSEDSLSGTVGGGGVLANELQDRSFEVQVSWRQVSQEEIDERLQASI